MSKKQYIIEFDDDVELADEGVIRYKINKSENNYYQTFKVGDEIIFGDDNCNFKGVVMDESDEPGVWMVFTENGCVEAFDERLLRKTVRYYNEVQKMLKLMRDRNK